MKHVTKASKKVLDTITQEMTQPGDHRKIDNGGTGIMAVNVELVCNTLNGVIFSVAHYYQQNGDLMRDPEMEFLRGLDGEYYPISFWMDGGMSIRHEAVSWTPNGQAITHYRPRMQTDITTFANTWMRNIREQQQISKNALAEINAV